MPAPPPPNPAPASPQSPNRRAQAQARAEVQLAERRLLEQERMSSYTDDAFDCESPHAMLTSSRGMLASHNPSELPNALYEAAPAPNAAAPATEAASPYLVVDSIGRLRVDSASDSDAHDDVAYGELAQPRPEIILRWKRFAMLVVLTAAIMSAMAAGLREGFIVYTNVPAKDAEDMADRVNSYAGLIMGFIESFVGLGVEEIFPVFIVYLHNLRWYPGDDPATKKQSKFKKFALTIFIPAVMMAVGSSLAAVQANQKDESSSSSNTTITTRHLQQELASLEGGVLENSILKAALTRRVEPMPPLAQSACSLQEPNAFSAETLLTAAPKATFGFPLQEWGMELGNGWSREETTRRYDVAYPITDSGDGGVTLSDVMPLATAYDLWLQGSALFLKQSRSTRRSHVSSKPSTVTELLDDISASFEAIELPLVGTAAVDATFETLTLNSLMDLQIMTLTVPLHEDANASLVCGASSCTLLNPQLSSGRRLPRKQIAMMKYATNCSLAMDGSSVSADCEVDANSAFLYGLTTVATAGSSKEDEPVAVSRSLVLSFARLSWRFDDFSHSCESQTDPDDDSCHVLHHQLEDSGRHLVLPKQWLPTRLASAGLTSSISLVQLLEPKFTLAAGQESQFATLEHLTAWPSMDTKVCSAVVDSYLQYVETNHLFLEGDMAESMAASGLLFLFQNARVLDAAPTVEIAVAQRRLADSPTHQVKVFLTNTSVGSACTWTGCGVLLVLTILVLALPNERARLSPPRGGNARAERFVAVQTEQIYPNLIYKKRFLIGKTGEEIKFGEFAVESVGLHHKMEEDEQIYI
ncbi:hypothetical protein BBJ28_00014363 [Nothophytophthora sp. Chile5]|nr:hypothetical protein BBJ28_00014363 [Nothophytophthora sp. Chile5]